MQPLPEWNDRVAQVQHDTAVELAGTLTCEPAQAGGVLAADRCRGLHLHTDNAAVCVLQHEIHLASRMSPQVEQFNTRVAPGSLLQELDGDEILKHWAERCGILGQALVTANQPLRG